MEHLVNILKVEGKYNYPTFCDEDGFQLYSDILESDIHSILRRIQRDDHHKDDITKYFEVEYCIRLARYTRRGSLNEAMY